jgi:hypothetical protein
MDVSQTWRIKMNTVTLLVDALVLTFSIVALLLLSLVLGGTMQAIWLVPVIFLWLFDALVMIKRME